MSKINSYKPVVEVFKNPKPVGQTVQTTGDKPKQMPLDISAGFKSKVKEFAALGDSVKLTLSKMLSVKLPVNPGDALKEIKNLPKPQLSDVSTQMPEVVRQAVYQKNLADYNTKVAKIADKAISNSTPPKLKDFKSSPEKSAVTQYREALNTYNGQITELKKISREAKQSNLENNAEFKKLPAATQQLVKTQLAKNEGSPQAVDTLVKLAQTEGFNKLSSEEQTKFLNYVGGTNKEISEPARQALEGKLNDPSFDSKNPESFRTFLKDQPGLTYVVSGTMAPGEFDSRRKTYTVTGPEEAKDHGFQSGKADADKYIVEVDGKKIPVFIAKGQDATLSYQTIDEVAKGLAALPKSSLDKVVSVQLDGKQNPDDAHWATEYNTPGFRSYMTAGADGNISIYPQTGKTAQEVLDASLIHETGHTLSKQNMGEGDGGFLGNMWRDITGQQKWSDWEAAAKKDGVSVSKYAKNSHDEDFAETLTLYMKVKGTPQEAEIRAIMPERFKFLDEMLKK
jgi:hypothetical protein